MAEIRAASIQAAKLHVSLSAESNLTANVGTASQYASQAGRLTTPRRIGISGQAQGEALFDGSEDVTIHTVISVLTNEELEDLLR